MNVISALILPTFWLCSHSGVFDFFYSMKYVKYFATIGEFSQKVSDRSRIGKLNQNQSHSIYQILIPFSL